MHIGDPCFIVPGKKSRYCFVKDKKGNQVFGRCKCSTSTQCGCKRKPGTKETFTDQQIDELKSATCKHITVPEKDEPAQCKKGQIPKESTLCTWWGKKTIGKACGGDLCSRGLLKAEQDAVVDKHNELRQLVASGKQPGQPGAKGGKMPNLEWDDNLAELAQAWADQCIFEHDNHGSTPLRRLEGYGYIGQNIAMSTSSYFSPESTTDVTGFVQDWFNEVKDLNKKNVHKFDSATNKGVVGHYTQVVWANTTKIGCGWVQFHRQYYEKFLFCDYYPGGNIVGQPLYYTK